MEAFPPSYTEATTSTRNSWPLIAPYLTKYELLTTSLVCRSWHQVFGARLWGNPSSHFDDSPRRGDDEPQPFELNRFRRCVKLASNATRSFVHTLRIPPSVADAASGGGLYGVTSSGLPATWLRDLVAMLPQLQSLILRAVDQVDAAALQAFAKTARDAEEDRVARQSLTPEFGAHVKLLDISHCNQVTAKGLILMLRRLENLLWLDMSRTPAVRDTSVLFAMQYLRSLKVLKLKGCKLGDDRASRLAAAIGRRIRWLDVEDNNMLGASSGLIDNCIGPPAADRDTYAHAPPSYTEASTTQHGRRRETPAQAFEATMHRTLTSGLTRHLAIEDEPEVGITHLRLSFAYAPSHLIAIKLLFESSTLSYLDMGATAIDFHPAHIRQQKTPCSMNYLRASWNVVTSLVPANTTTQYHSDFSSVFPCLETLVLITESSYAGSGTPGYANARNATAAITNLIRILASSHSPKPPLRKLVLEVASRPTNTRLQYAGSSRTNDFSLMTKSSSDPSRQAQAQKSRGWNYSPSSKTVTGDVDSERLWHYAAEKDFSFFDEENGEETSDAADMVPKPPQRPATGLMTTEAATIDRLAGGIGEERPSKLPPHAPQHAIVDRIAGGMSWSRSRQNQKQVGEPTPLPPPYQSQPQPQQSEPDIVKEVAAFRAGARKAYEWELRQQEEKRGSMEAAREIAARVGFWDGVVEVVRV